MKTLLLTLTCLLLLLSGCSKTVFTVDKAGLVTITRIRVLMKEDIDSASFDATDGSFTFDGYKSDMTRLVELIRLLADKEDEFDPLRKVRP